MSDVYALSIFNYIPHKQYTNDDFNVKVCISDVDEADDGIDDQTDILNNARAYIATNPSYKSRLGYPDAEYGVCSDIVVFWLKDAGYDLMELVNEHFESHRDLYDIAAVDKNIDFRRVRNLKVYFEHNAVSLTIDKVEISWYLKTISESYSIKKVKTE